MSLAASAPGGPTAGTWPRVERRSGEDRRAVSKPFSDWRWIYRGRRTGGRRAEDRGRDSVDLYPPRLLFLTIGILLLSGLDAGLTLTLLESGVVMEANPVMRALLEHGTGPFVGVKTAVTGGALLVLVGCSHLTFLNVIRVERLVQVVCLGYVALIGYELVLLRAAFGS